MSELTSVRPDLLNTFAEDQTSRLESLGDEGGSIEQAMGKLSAFYEAGGTGHDDGGCVDALNSYLGEFLNEYVEIALVGERLHQRMDGPRWPGDQVATGVRPRRCRPVRFRGG